MNPTLREIEQHAHFIMADRELPEWVRPLLIEMALWALNQRKLD